MWFAEYWLSNLTADRPDFEPLQDLCREAATQNDGDDDDN